METSSRDIIKVLKGSAISVIVTLILLAIFAALLTYTKINEATMPTVIIVITVLSILIGSQFATQHIKKNGILNGALVGGIYIISIYIISSIVTKNFALNTYAIIMIVTSILVGGLGGIIGVNRK